MAKKSEVEQIIVAINAIFCQHNIATTITENDIFISGDTSSPGVVYDFCGRVMSNAIRESIFPAVEDTMFYHFTSREKAESILEQRALRLTNISKHFDEMEVKSFLTDHNLQGYLVPDDDGEQRYKNVLNDMYFISFTSANMSEEEQLGLWSDFANKGQGVRLKIEINPLLKITPEMNPLFKKIYYGNGQPIPLLGDLMSSIKKINSNLTFIFKSISTDCGLYLPGRYSSENEYRYLYKYHGTPDNSDSDVWKERPTPVADGDYVLVPLDKKCQKFKCQFKYEFKLVEICSQQRISIPCEYSDIPVIKPFWAS